MMKAGNLSRLWGRQYSFMFFVLIFVTIFLWSWEKNPPFNMPLMDQDQLIVPNPDDIDDSSWSLDQKNHAVEHNSFSQVVEEIEKEETESGLDFAEMDNKNNTLSSLERKNDFDDSSASLNQKSDAVEANSFSQVVEEIDKEETDSGTDFAEMDDKNSTLSYFKSKACNFAKGRWVADKRRPLYSGFGCKQWLSDMWACRLTQRIDFTYEGYRWQPESCAMPEFDGSKFLKKMQDKTIAFVGDSLGRQQFQSLMCMVTGGEERLDIEDIGWKFGLIKPPGAIRPDGWAYWFSQTNTTILYYWSASLCGIEPINATDPATKYAMHLDRPPAFLERYLNQFHVLVLNTGHHWNRGKLVANRWVMHANGKPVTDRKLAQIANAKNLTVYSIVRWVDSQMSLHPQLKAFFRTISPRHFFHGDWNTGGRCDNMVPLARGGEVTQDESSDPVVGGAVKGTKVKILDVTAISELRDEAHMSRYGYKASEGAQDCLHWCLPGVPDTWNELLCAQV